MKKPKLRQGLSLERFAHAKTASYDKQKAKEKAFALNAKKVNKYRKLKQRLAKEGRLVPLARPIVEDDSDEEMPSQKAPKSNEDSRPHGSQGGAALQELDRIRSRAGPVPDEEGDLSDGSDVIGEEIDEDEGEQQSRGAQQGRSTHDQGSLQRSAGASAAGPPGSEKIAGESRQGEEGIAGKASLHGKHHRSKPLSRVQRIAAEVQARKDAEAKARKVRRAGIEAHKARVVEAEKQRKQKTKLLRKRTRHGQPVMRYRMDKLLDQLQAEAQQS
ncbi:hypothetical protein WJX75_006136 [Coccomyxa subellipsoidea]|uniref:rRNA-processing protein FYV7 n=1 Tax=Coccomyxa subellipsoidea TaxID=248742 RepID=A0ABR2YJP1_9CHLO